MSDNIIQLPDEQEDKPLHVHQKSLIGKWASERWSVLRELWRSHVSMVDFYMSPRGGSLSMEDAQRITSGEYVFSDDRSEDGKLTLVPKIGTKEEKVDTELSQSLSWDVDNLSWYGLDHLFRVSPDLAEQVWDEVKEQAAKDFKSGHFAAELFERTEWQKSVWKRAHFVAVFQAMVESYKPQDAIEHQMVEMAAVEYFLWRHWTAEHLHRATTDPRGESHEFQEYKRIHCRPHAKQWGEGHWDVPYQSEAEAVRQAAELADRFRRAYQAAVRGLRDWRRYPVIVQNAEQVNIATDGGQQVNLQKNRQSKKRGKGFGSTNKSKQSNKEATKRKQKQLGPKLSEESIRIKPASEPAQVK